LRCLEPLGQRVWADHDQLDLHLAALLELRLHLANVRLEGPAEHVNLEDARRERVLDGVVDLFASHTARQRSDGDCDLLLLGFRDGVHKPGCALDRRVSAIKPANHLDVVLKLRRLADARLADDVTLPVLNGVAAEGHDLEGAADTDGRRIWRWVVSDLYIIWLKPICNRSHGHVRRPSVVETGQRRSVSSRELWHD